MTVRPASKTRAQVVVVERGKRRQQRDHLATEEPLEVRVTAGGQQRTVAITMRTPGADFELAAGFLLGEGVISERDEIERINYCVRADIDIEQRYNIVTVALRRPTLPDLASLDRHFVTSSACGVCGKASLDALELRSCAVLPAEPQINSELLFALPDLLRTNQTLFAATGGLHGAALFDRNGALLAVREDVGRHNAVDKLIGWALMQDLLPLNQHILLVSGRTSFEIMQKALAAGLPIVCGVSAPSSLAVALAQRFNMTLVGFLRGERYNVYAGAARLID